MAVNSNPVLQNDAAVILLFHVVFRRKVQMVSDSLHSMPVRVGNEAH